MKVYCTWALGGGARLKISQESSPSPIHNRRPHTAPDMHLGR